MIFEAMIVDDEAPARVELTSQLERTGRVQVVSEAVCLQEAIAKLKRKRIDVCFIDHNIAGANTELLPEALPHLAKVPMLIYMTAYSDVMDEPFGVEPMGYLVKPVDNRKLDEVIAMLDAAYARVVHA
jgi:two-component SAPR family response regulator